MTKEERQLAISIITKQSILLVKENTRTESEIAEMFNSKDKTDKALAAVFLTSMELYSQQVAKEKVFTEDDMKKCWKSGRNFGLNHNNLSFELYISQTFPKI